MRETKRPRLLAVALGLAVALHLAAGPASAQPAPPVPIGTAREEALRFFDEAGYRPIFIQVLGIISAATIEPLQRANPGVERERIVRAASEAWAPEIEAMIDPVMGVMADVFAHKFTAEQLHVQRIQLRMLRDRRTELPDAELTDEERYAKARTLAQPPGPSGDMTAEEQAVGREAMRTAMAGLEGARPRVNERIVAAGLNPPGL